MSKFSNAFKRIIVGSLFVVATVLPVTFTTPATAESILCPGIADVIRERAANVDSETLRDQLLGIADGICTPGEESDAGTPTSVFSPTGGAAPEEECEEHEYGKKGDWVKKRDWNTEFRNWDRDKDDHHERDGCRTDRWQGGEWNQGDWHSGDWYNIDP